jgi:hypothetical protein
VTRRSRDVAREADVGYKASTRGVMAKRVLYMIGGWYVEGVDTGRHAVPQTHSNAPADLGFAKP